MFIVPGLECTPSEASVRFHMICICPRNSCFVHKFSCQACTIQGAVGGVTLTVTARRGRWDIVLLAIFEFCLPRIVFMFGMQR